MNKSIQYLIICLLPVFLISCGECEDETKRVDATFLSWFPYEEETPVSFTNANSETSTFTLRPGEDIQTEPKGDDCTRTFIKPFMQLDTDEQERRLNIWLHKTDELVGGDRNQLWGVLDGEDGLIEASGTHSNLNSIEAEPTTVSLNGTIFIEVISLTLNKNDVEVMTVFLQKDIGLVGYDYLGETWVLDE